MVMERLEGVVVGDSMLQGRHIPVDEAIAITKQILLGLAAAHEQRPDAIVLDMRMPDMDGSEVHARLRQNPHLSSIPVIFLSANVQDSARHSALAEGAFAYLTKPYDPREVVATVLEAIARRNGSHAAADRSQLHAS